MFRVCESCNFRMMSKLFVSRCGQQIQSICLNIPHPPLAPHSPKTSVQWNELKKMPIKVSNMSLWKLPAKEQATTYLNPLIKMTDTPKLTHHTNWSKVLSKISTVDFPPPISRFSDQIPNPSTSRQMNPNHYIEQNKKHWHLAFWLSSTFVLSLCT